MTLANYLHPKCICTCKLKFRHIKKKRIQLDKTILIKLNRYSCIVYQSMSSGINYQLVTQKYADIDCDIDTGLNIAD